MALIRLMGMDPALKNWGYAAGIYNTETHHLEMTGIDVIQTKTTRTKSVRKNSIDLQRAVVLSNAANNLTQTAHFVFVEIPVGSQTARAMTSYGICVGILSSLKSNGVSLIEVSAENIKRTVTGNPLASKKDMISFASNTHPDLGWPFKTIKGTKKIVASKAEHMADAIGAIYAGIETDDFKNSIKIIN